MRGVVKLKVPAIPMIPKLFVITLTRDQKQHRFSKVAFDLESAIKKCWYEGKSFTVHNYITHTELSVTEINNLFKNFNL